MNTKEESNRPPSPEDPPPGGARRLTNRRGTRRALFAFACVVTLVAGYYLVVKWQGSRAWRHYRQEASRQGVSLDFMTFVPPRVADEQNFAMTPFLAPLFDFQPGAQAWRDTNGYQRLSQLGGELSRIRRDPGWRKVQRTDLAAVVEQWDRRESGERDGGQRMNRSEAARRILELCQPHEPILAELRQASQRPHARFNVRYEHDPFYGVLLPHVSLIRGLCQMLEFRASAALALGQPDAAFRDTDLLLGLADSLRDEPLVISHLVREACFQIGLQVVWEGLADRRWDAVQIERLQQRLGAVDLIREAYRCLEAERAAGNRSLEHVWRSGGWMKEATDDLPPPQLLAVLPRGWLYFEQLNYNRAFDQFVLTAFDPSARRVDATRAKANDTAMDLFVRDRPILKHRVACGVLLPSLGNLARKAAHGQTSLDLAVLGCALERYRLDHGRYPAVLDALVPKYANGIRSDVLNGRPPRYRLEDSGGFLLYSAGWNEEDEGGAVAYGKRQTWDPAQGDWVWRYPEAPGGVLPSTIAR